MARSKQKVIRTSKTAEHIPTRVIYRLNFPPNPAKISKIGLANVLKTFRCGTPLSWKYPQSQSRFQMMLHLRIQDEICFFEDNCQKLELQKVVNNAEIAESVSAKILEEKQIHGKLWWSDLCSKTNSNLEIYHGDTLTLVDSTNEHKFMAYWTQRNVDGTICADYLMLPVYNNYKSDYCGVPPDFCDAPEEWFKDIESFFVHPNYVIPDTYAHDLLRQQSATNPGMEGHIPRFCIDYIWQGERLIEARTLYWVRVPSEDEQVPKLEVPLVEYYQRRKEREHIWKQINCEVLKITLKPLELPIDIIKCIANFLF